MAAGLQIWDQNGNVILDGTYRVGRFLGSQYIQGGSGLTGSIPDSRLSQGGWFAWQPTITNGDGYLSGGIVCPSFSISGSVLTWTYPAVNNASLDTIQSGTILYGVS